MDSNNSFIIEAKYVLTDDDFKVNENHALIVENGTIIEILPCEIALQKYPNIQTEKLKSHVLLPGFINAHTHVPMNYFRGLADDLSLQDWLNNHIWPAEKKWLSDEFVYDASLFAMAEMIRGGTTCFNDMYFFLKSIARAAETAGLRAFLGKTILDFETAWSKDVNDYLSKGLEFYTHYKNHDLIRPTIAPHSVYALSDESLLKVKDFSEKYDTHINIDLHESPYEIQESLAKTNLTPLQRLHHLDMVSEKMIAIHMTQISDIDFEILEAKKPHIVHCPESNLKLANGYCPVEKLISHGVNVCIGTDSAASNNDLNMICEMRTANLLAKLSSGNPKVCSAENTLKMATLNGAKALGIDHLAGSLKAGKAADFIAMDLDRIETQPLYHPISQIVYSSDRTQATDVWVQGKRLLKNRKLMTLEEDYLLEKAKEWGEKIKRFA